MKNILKKITDLFKGKDKSDNNWETRKKELIKKVRVNSDNKNNKTERESEPNKKRTGSPSENFQRKKRKYEPGGKQNYNRRTKGGAPKPRPAAEIKTKEESSWDPSKYIVEAAEGKKRFLDFNIPNEILHAVADLNFKYATPIQAESLPPALDGKDILGRAQTGTGKTAAFLIAVFNHILKNPKEKAPGRPRALILAPTRELVVQIHNDAKALAKYTAIKTVSVFGGVDYAKQQKYLSGNCDVVVATPGRLQDYIDKKVVNLSKVEILVVDEADRMLDMGFIDDMHKIIARTPSKDDRQTLLFSATISSDVKNLSKHWTNNPSFIDIEPEKVAGESIDQTVYLTSSEEKLTVLYNLITKKNLEKAIVFATRRDQTRDLVDFLRERGISTLMLSGDVHQRKRLSALQDFKEGKFKVLIATDVAGRGLHIDDVTHVINFSLPEDAEDYVHRIGRTGRAGASGKSISFACEEDSFHIPAIEKFLGKKMEYSHPDEDLLVAPPPPSVEITKERKPRPNTKKNYNRRKPYQRKNGKRSSGS